MTSPIFAPRAQRELRAAAVWIAEDNPADALLAAAMAAARRLQARPKLGRVRLELAPGRYRFGPCVGFLIFWSTTPKRSRRLSSVSCISPAICRGCSIFSPRMRPISTAFRSPGSTTGELFPPARPSISTGSQGPRDVFPRGGKGAQPRPVSTTGGLPRSMISVTGPLATIFPLEVGSAGVDDRAIRRSCNPR